MHFLIDAYNTIGQVFSLSEPQKEDKLIEFLQKQFESTKDTLTVVFDNPRALPHGHHFHRARIRVVVTHEGESADDWLIRKMTQIQTQEFSKNKMAAAKKYQVVSSDREILNAAKKTGVGVQSPESFIRWSRTLTQTDPPEKPHRVSDRELDLWESVFSKKSNCPDNNA